MKKTPRSASLAARVWLLNYKFFGGRRWYQYIEFDYGISTGRYTGPRGAERTSSFLDWLEETDLLCSEDVVMDLGSNAAYLSVRAADKVSQVRAVEIDRRFHRQAQFVLNYFRSKKIASNVLLYRTDVYQRLDLLDDVTVLFASKFLYHRNFSNQLEAFLGRVQDSKIRLIVIQGHITQGDLGTESGISILLEKYGFIYEYRIAGTSDYPIGIAIRSCEELWPPDESGEPS